MVPNLPNPLKVLFSIGTAIVDYHHIVALSNDLAELMKTQINCTEEETCYVISKANKKLCRPKFDPSRKSFLEIFDLRNEDIAMVSAAYVVLTVILQ